MSQYPTTPQPEEPVEPVSTEVPEVVAPAKTPTEAAVEDDSTIGTGTSMALGCIAGTVLLIIFGLIFLLISNFV